MQSPPTRHTKIVCTLGPASEDPAVLDAMIRAGMDVARLNFSHGTHESHESLLTGVRQAADRAGRVIGILQDLSGPKIRVGHLPEDGVALVEGAQAIFRCAADARWSVDGIIPVVFAGLTSDLAPGTRLLFDDGTMEVRVDHVLDDIVEGTVVRGGRLRSRKGLNLPGVDLRTPSVTPKDLDDLEWGLAHGVDAVALSFVRRASDLDPVRRRLDALPPLERPLLYAKIETPQAVDNIDKILSVVDGIMVARGDLAVEMDFECVPLIQKQLLRLAALADIPTITATQMLESMIIQERPTRAEASDVANAILDGTDAVMLSAESASGKNPVAAVDAMARIATRTDRATLEAPDGPAAGRNVPPSCLHDALALGVERIARGLDIRAIVAATEGGDTARYLASSRPRVPVLVISPNPRALGQATFAWGLSPVPCPPFEAPGEALKYAEDAVRKSGLAGDGDAFVLVAGRGPSGIDAGTIQIRALGIGAVPHARASDEDPVS